MDELDMKIFRSFLKGSSMYFPHTDVRRSILSVAKELGINEGTVRRRLGKLQEGGFLRGWLAFINPAALGKPGAHLRFDVLPPSSKEDVMKKVSLIDGVYLVRNYYGDAIGVDLFCDDERSLDKTTELISRISNADTIVRAIERPDPHPFVFDHYDLKIVKSIQDSPRKPLEQISKETGLSTKKVKRKIQWMLDGHALLVARSINYRVLTGMIKGDLLVFYDSPLAKKGVDNEVARILGERALVSFLGEADHAAFNLMLANLSERNQILSAVKQTDGVEKAYLDLTEDNIEVYETFKRQVEMLSKRMRALQELA